MNVIKRDGTLVDFNPQKIVDAVTKAYLKGDKVPNIDAILSIAKSIEELDRESISIEEIQNYVENALMELDKDIAKSYVIYRDERNKQRRLIKTYNEIVEIEDTYNKKENANINGNTPSGQMMKFASATSTDYSSHHLIKDKYIKEHGKTIYIHDLDYFSTKASNCLMADLGDILKGGFKVSHGFVKEPNRLSVAVELTCIIIQTSQNEFYGGQAIHCFDYALVPYAKKSFKEHFVDTFLIRQKTVNFNLFEDVSKQIETKYGTIELANTKLKEKFPKTYDIAKYKLIKEANQSMQGLVYNLNSMASRGGRELPSLSEMIG